MPVLVSKLTYKGLTIGKGDQAMLAWWKMVYGDNSLLSVANRSMSSRTEAKQSDTGSIKKQEIATSLLKYCELDTWAMVMIWRKLEML